MMNPKFKDSKSEQYFDENGYYIIKGFLSPHQVSTMLELYRKYHNTFVDRLMWNSLYHTKREDSLHISEEVLKLFNPKLKETFNDYRTILATIMSKCPYQADGFDTPHRDYSILDESKFEYRQLWCPLVDVNENNGCMYVIPKSHKLPHSLLPVMNKCKYRECKDELMPRAKPLYMQAGDLLVYADRTLHGGFHNATTEERPVIHFAVLPQNAGLKYYRKTLDSEGLVEEYDVPDMFYINNVIDDIQNLPVFSDGKLVRTFKLSLNEHFVTSP